MTLDVTDIVARADLEALVLVDTQLRRVGKELHGPCPLCTCSSTERRHQCDRFRVAADRHHWFCRHCSPRGGNAIDYAIKRYGVTFPEACRIAVGDRHPTPLAPRQSHRTNIGPTLPSATWQARGRQLVDEAVKALWSSAGVRALEYLRGRGFSGRTIKAWQLGYLPAGGLQPAADWGLPPDREVYLHRGILVPWFTTNGTLTGLKIRKPVPSTERNKFASISGSTYRVYGTQTIVSGEPLVLVEGEFDAMAAWQVLGDRTATVALGTARVPDAAELRLLCCAQPVLVALDADDTGDRVAEQIVALSPNCRRARPPGAKDVAACVEAGVELSSWFRSALEEASGSELRG
jgi:DNA primase